MKADKKPRFAFFGTPEFARTILDELEKAGFSPGLVIAAPDKPQGRHLVLTPPPTKEWALERGIETFQPATLKTEETRAELSKRGPWDLFIVAAYGKIIPKEVLDMPRKGSLNVHPSLLPRLRGASPVQSSVLTEDRTGVTIMLLDEEMDHGPIVAQEEAAVSDWPPRADVLEELLAREGGRLLAETIAPWMEGRIETREQDHSKATFCKKIAKEDGKINLDDDPETNLRKIRAFAGWPGAYFFAGVPAADGGEDRFVRVVIKEAELARDGSLRILRVVPEGKKEMGYDDFLRGFKRS